MRYEDAEDEEDSVNDRLRKLRQRLPRNNQRGFTLIELLVVISILGILAAVVTMSMVGVTKLAQDRAGATEKSTVQAALDTMANEQLVPPDQICPSLAATSDMSTFPTNATPAPASSPSPPPATGHSVALYPRYLRQQITHGSYTCSADGVVTQTAYNP